MDRIVTDAASLAESMSLLIYERETRGVESNLGRYLVRFKTEALQ